MPEGAERKNLGPEGLITKAEADLVKHANEEEFLSDEELGAMDEELREAGNAIMQSDGDKLVYLKLFALARQARKARDQVEWETQLRVTRVRQHDQVHLEYPIQLLSSVEGKSVLVKKQRGKPDAVAVVTEGVRLGLKIIDFNDLRLAGRSNWDLMNRLGGFEDNEFSLLPGGCDYRRMAAIKRAERDLAAELTREAKSSNLTAEENGSLVITADSRIIDYENNKIAKYHLIRAATLDELAMGNFADINTAVNYLLNADSQSSKARIVGSVRDGGRRHK